MSAFQQSLFAPQRADDFARSPRHVMILMATFNGAKAVRAQLDSFVAQSHRDWSLLVSDDGSTDGTQEIIRAFAAAHPDHRITLIRGPQKGSAQNFLSLLRAAGRVPFVAFADQDDVWLTHKLERALDKLDGVRGPAVYGSRTVIADDNLNPLRLSPLFRREKCFRNALVQNVAGGNTMVLNRAALDKLQPLSRRATAIIAHDWWCYQVVTGLGGAMIYDPCPGLLYRQHGNNQIGANDTPKAMIQRLKRLASGGFRDALSNQLSDLENAADHFMPHACETFENFLRHRKSSGIRRWQAYRSSGIYRQTRRGSLALGLAALFGRL